MERPALGPEKLAVEARAAVTEAVRDGRLRRGRCAVCGTPKTEAHHHRGYAEAHWLTVSWLCRTHHAAAHFQMRVERGLWKWSEVRRMRNGPDDQVGLSLGDLRITRGVSQTELATRLGRSQPAISELERREDVFISTLREYVEALGGRLEVAAVFEGDERVELAIAAN